MSVQSPSIPFSVTKYDKAIPMSETPIQKRDGKLADKAKKHNTVFSRMRNKNSVAVNENVQFHVFDYILKSKMIDLTYFH